LLPQVASVLFLYKGKAIDLKQIGHELGVHYVLEGSILRSGERMRVNTQLVDAETGAHLWAERFDKEVADLFATQDEIVARVAGQLDAALVSAEARRAERSPHPDSTDFFFRGKACLNKGYDPVELARAQAFFSEALRIDPENVDALAWTVFVDALLAVSNYNAQNGAARLAAAERNGDYDLTKRFLEEIQKKETAPKPVKTEPDIAELIVTERPKRGSLTKFESQLIKEFKAMLEGHKRRNVALYRLALLTQLLRLKKERAKRLRALNAQKEQKPKMKDLFA
jgi:hypothetical protein